jgi:hypothetical protein
MFGFGSKDKKSDKRPAPAKGAVAGGQGKDKGSQGLTGEALRAQALANAKAARIAIGEETLDKIAAAMTKKQQSATEQAKRKIQNADAERVALEILAMIGED